MEGVKLGARSPVRVEVTIGPSEVLTVVHIEVQVVKGVMGRAVDVLLEPVAGNHVAIVNEDGPDLDKNEKYDVEVLLYRENKDENANQSVRKIFDGTEATITYW